MEKPQPILTNTHEAIATLASRSSHKTLAIWSADCAERVLPYFEHAYPTDNRPRNAIAAGRAWILGELKMTEARKAAFSAHAAAREATQIASACFAARAAGHAAATAHVATHAVYAASYAVRAIQNAHVMNEIMVALLNEREWQYRHLRELGITT